MHPDWQDRKPSKELIGFRVTFKDGHQKEIKGGLINILDIDLKEHGRVVKAIAIEK